MSVGPDRGASQRPVVLVVGAASRDLVPEDARSWRLGGAVTYASLALARFGFEVRAVVGADDEAAEAEELDLLRQAGVTMAIARLESGPVFDNVRHMLHAESEPIPVTALPRGWTSGFDGALFVPVAGEVGEAWSALARPRREKAAGRQPSPIVGVGWQGFLRVLVAGSPVRPAPPRTSTLLRAARIVVTSREDAAPGTRPEALLELLGPHATLVWTEGLDGGMTLTQPRDGREVDTRRYRAIPSDSVVDPTGAGDVFLAALLAATISPSIAAPYDALVFAAAAGSLAVEGPGLHGVPDLAAVRARMTRLPSLARRRPRAVSRRTSGRPSQA